MPTQTQPKPQTKAAGEKQYDICIIGGGPGGYVAAIRAAQLGASVVVIEKEYLGGTCLNWGCIPSKAMIASVERLNHVRHADKLGVTGVGEPKMDMKAFAERRDKIVKTLRGGIGQLLKKNKITHIEGFAKFVDKGAVEVDGKKITAKSFILAMGTRVYKAEELPIEGLKGDAKDGIWTSDDTVSGDKAPKSMLIIGAGAVGVEFAYVYNGLGTEVTVVEMLPELIPMMDEDLSAELAKQFKKQGIATHTSTKVESAKRTKDGWKCALDNGGKKTEVSAEVVLIATGRKPNTADMNLEEVGVKLDRGYVTVKDDTLVTHAPNIYAIGDLNGKWPLAHVASAEGIRVVTNIIKGESRPFDYKAVPNCVYTVPEVAAVGLSEREAKTEGYDVLVGRYDFRALGKAMAAGEQEGFVKVVAESRYGEVLGVHMIGAHVTDMIHEGVVALKLEATLDYMVEAIHAHPTMSEAVLEAFEDAHGMAIHK